MLFALTLVAFLVFSPTVPGAVTRISVALALISLGVFLFGHESLRQERTVVIGLFCYFGAALLSLLNTSDWHFAYWRLEKYSYVFAGIAILAFVKRVPLRTEAVLLWGSAFAALILAGVGIWQTQIDGISRAGLGDDFNPNRFGTVAFSYALLIIVGLRTLSFSLPLQCVLMLAVVAAIIGGLASGSRGALFGFFAALPVVILTGRSAPRKRYIAEVLALLFVAGLSIVMLATNSPLWKDQFVHIYTEAADYLSGRYYVNEPTSLGTRLGLLIGAAKIWQANPVVGTGVGDIQVDLDELIASGVVTLDKSFAYIHNLYFDALATTGIIGFSTLIAGVFLLPWNYFQSRLESVESGSWERFAALGGKSWILYYAACGLSSSWLFNRGSLPYWVPLFVLLGASGRKPKAIELAVTR